MCRWFKIRNSDNSITITSWAPKPPRVYQQRNTGCRQCLNADSIIIYANSFHLYVSSFIPFWRRLSLKTKAKSIRRKAINRKHHQNGKHQHYCKTSIQSSRSEWQGGYWGVWWWGRVGGRCWKKQAVHFVVGLVKLGTKLLQIIPKQRRRQNKIDLLLVIFAWQKKEGMRQMRDKENGSNNKRLAKNKIKWHQNNETESKLERKNKIWS